MRIPRVYGDRSIALSPRTTPARSGTDSLCPAQGVMVASALGAFMWGLFAGVVWLVT
jgi:hypothetical protein